MNTKYITSNAVKKTQYFSPVGSTSKYADIFTTRDEIYLVFAKKKILCILYSTVKQTNFSPGRFSFDLTFPVCLLGVTYLGNGFESYFNE